MINDYAEPILSLKQEIKFLEEACLHNKLEKFPQILRNIEIEHDRLDLWYWKQKKLSIKL